MNQKIPHELNWALNAGQEIEALRSSVRYADLRAEATLKRQFTLNEQGVQGIRSAEHSGGCIRVLNQGNFGFASFEDPSRLHAMLNEARDAANHGPKGEHDLAEVSVHQDAVFHEFEVNPFELHPSRIVQTLNDYREFLLREGQPEVKSLSLRLVQSLDSRQFLSTEGAHIFQQTGHCQLIVMVQGFSDDQKPVRMVEVLGSTLNGVFHEDQIENLRILLDKFRRIRPARTMASTQTTVVLDPLLAGVFAHESFGHTSEADLFAMKPGGLDTLKLGRRFGPKGLNIYDTPFIPGYPGALKYDDEGVLCQRSPLLEDGVLTGRMHTRETAFKLKERPTGNARAMNTGFTPMVRMRNTCIGEGNASLEELLSGIDEGIYCAGCYGGTGGEDFTFSASHGYRIRNGKIAEPVREITIRGNLFQTLQDVEGVGRHDLSKTTFGSCGKGAQFPLPVGMTSPHIRVRNMMIGGAE